jgi:hypothetical protein
VTGGASPREHGDFFDQSARVAPLQRRWWRQANREVIFPPICEGVLGLSEF